MHLAMAKLQLTVWMLIEMNRNNTGIYKLNAALEVHCELDVERMYAGKTWDSQVC